MKVWKYENMKMRDMYILHLFFMCVLLTCTSCKEKEKKNTQQKTVVADSIQMSVQPKTLVKKPAGCKGYFCIFPVDETDQDPSFAPFLSNLKKAVAKKDTALLFALCNDEIVSSWGGGIIGIKGFKETWGLDTTLDSRVWGAITHILSQGGAYQKDDGEEMIIVYPSQSAYRFWEGAPDHDCYGTAVCLSDEVRIYTDTSNLSHPIELLSYELMDIDLIHRLNSDTWEHCSTFDKRVTGYIKKTDLEYCANGKMGVAKRYGVWQIIFYAPFD